MEGKRYKILIADDHPIVADGLAEILKQEERFVIAGRVQNGMEVLQFLQSDYVDLILMDISMPLMDGIKCTKAVKQKFPDIGILILTMYNQQHFLRELIKAGANGCMLKNKSGLDLIQAIDRIISGKSFYDNTSDHKLSTAELTEAKLSEREIEIVVAIAEGHTSKDIAQKLYISEHTVKTHRKNIFRKLNLNDAADLTRYALEHGII
jgi:DNA-binding NarL/FixJ family response regulator